MKGQQRNRLRVQHAPQTRKSLVKGERFIRCVWKTWLVLECHMDNCSNRIHWDLELTMGFDWWREAWSLPSAHVRAWNCLLCMLNLIKHTQVHYVGLLYIFVLKWLVPDAHVCFGVSGAVFGTCKKPYLTVGHLTDTHLLVKWKQANVAWSV